MNIFILDKDPILAAKYHCDQHVPKMILEGAQMLSTAACRLYGRRFVELYQPTHANHPCTKWVAACHNNRVWLMTMLQQLQNERVYRWDGKGVHTSLHIALKAFEIIQDKFGQVEPCVTAFAQAMPEQYKRNDAVLAYRNYYMGEKMSIKGGATWTRRGCPEWIGENKYLFGSRPVQTTLFDTKLETQ